jgi:hypothetical protein
VLHSSTKCNPLLTGSSPAQASVAPIAHEKEESRLYCGKDKKSVSLSDTRLKEPVVRLNRLTAEVKQIILLCITHVRKILGTFIDEID